MSFNDSYGHQSANSSKRLNDQSDHHIQHSNYNIPNTGSRISLPEPNNKPPCFDHSNNFDVTQLRPSGQQHYHHHHHRDSVMNFHPQFSPIPPPSFPFSAPPPPPQQFSVPPPTRPFLHHPPRHPHQHFPNYPRKDFAGQDSLHNNRARNFNVLEMCHFNHEASYPFLNRDSQCGTTNNTDESNKIEGKIGSWLESIQDRLMKEGQLEGCERENNLFNCKTSNERSLDGDELGRRLSTWFESVQGRIKRERNSKKSKTKIIDIQHAAFDCGTSICDLEDIVNCVPPNNAEDKEKWMIWKAETKTLMDQIKSGFKFFEEMGSTTAEGARLVIEERRRKRKRSRISKKRKILARLKYKKIRGEIEDNIDRNIQFLRQEHLNEMRESKLKKEADAVLKEVRSKQEDVSMMREFLSVLSSLREVRIKKGDVHGHVSDEKTNEIFDRLKGTFFDLLSHQMDHYRQEEETLKVMMGDSRIPRSSTDYDNLIDVEKVKQYTHEALFGEGKICSNSEPQKLPASDLPLNLLIKRRRDWDQFLQEGENSRSKYGGQIPLGWVFNKTPNSDWKKFLVDE